MTLQAGSLLNRRYRIQKRLGRGGFGAAYLALDENLNRLFVVKENLDTSPEAREQFEYEARLLARKPEETDTELDLANGLAEEDPGLPHVYNYLDLDKEGQFLVMEYIEGVDLLSLVDKQGAVDQEDAIAWVHEVGQSLAYLHNLTPPLIHRDVKPANIRISPSLEKPHRARLIDFGLAKNFQVDEKTVLGARAISPGYSPPEQYTLAGTDVRSDVYSLGATIYFLLTGKEPVESVQRMIRETLVPPHERNGRVDPKISAAVMKAMSLDADGRYDTIADFLAAIKAEAVTPDQLPTQRISPTRTIELLAADAVPKRDTGAVTVANEADVPAGEPAETPNWFRQNITALVYAFIALCIVGFTFVVTLIYVRNLPAISLAFATQTPTATMTAIPTSTLTHTPPPTETPPPSSTPTYSPSPTLTFTPTQEITASPSSTLTTSPSATETFIPPPTVTPVSPEVPLETAQAEIYFDISNVLSTPQGTRILVQNDVVNLEHNDNPGTVLAEVDVGQEDFVVRVVFGNPYAGGEGDWDYGFFVRIRPENRERFSISVTSNKIWELRYYEDGLDTEGEVIEAGVIQNLNTGQDDFNILMVILDGENGYLIVNNNEIFLLDLSQIVAQGVIEVATGIRPGYKRADIGAVTRFWDLSIYDLTTE